MGGGVLSPKSIGGARSVHIICPSCQSSIVLTAAFTRFCDMPVRCAVCRHAFDMPRRACGMRGAGGKEASTVPFAGTVSAQRNHHPIRCGHCRHTLLLAGKDPPVHSIWLTCPLCNRSFRHNSRHWLSWQHSVALASGTLIFAGVLVLDHNRLIALEHMTGWPSLAETSAHTLEELQDRAVRAFEMVKDLALRMRDTLQDKLDQVRTAAMARLV